MGKGRRDNERPFLGSSDDMRRHRELGGRIPLFTFTGRPRPPVLVLVDSDFLETAIRSDIQSLR